MFKNIIILLVLLSIGLGFGGGLAEYLRATDRNEAGRAVRLVPNNATNVYSIKRMQAEGTCIGNKYSFYGRGFEVIQLHSGIYNEFSIKRAYPISIEFKRGCGAQTLDADKLCESLLGAHLTIPEDDPIVGDTHLPVSGERKDELFDNILKLPGFRSKYYFVGFKGRDKPFSSEKEYDYHKPKTYIYPGSFGQATVEEKSTDYELIKDEGEVLKLLVICLIAGGLLGLGIGFGLLKVVSSGQRLKAIKQT
jgi:hypothetical protein